MKIGSLIGASIICETGVFDMKNFDPTTIAFWATLTGLLFFAIVASFVGEGVQEKLNQLIQWLGNGKKIHLKAQ